MGSPGKLGSNVCFAVEIRESLIWRYEGHYILRINLLGFRILMSDLKCDTSLVYLGKCTLAANKV